ncbi:MAG: NAD(P)/FAD-dependent oxidoreductase [Myxococcales bacterium]|nr:NAD(P)/FAD-dependent oxidoreductase [Myxococcales bacterium]MCB9670154.1 NAD(P)/FAD-dependent oxidoreductase [Alphaproteobacteria bacterium]MCB9693595.1 NAD(P)/FAD-dependent oxidoreductase [Alphaproteobacteria bacterium]
MSHHEVLIVGGGAAGITLASLLTKEGDVSDVAIIEPSEVHYYQPLFTLVGGGVFKKGDTSRAEAKCIPPGVTWIKDRAATFDPANNSVTLAGGDTVTYDVLAVCPGLQLDWDRVEGLKDAVGKNGVVSNYSPDTVESTWEAIRHLKGGKAIFTYPQNPIKCAGAPQKIMWLAEHHFERAGIRDKVEITYATTGGAIFGIPRYAKTLARLADERNIHLRYMHDLVGIRAAEKKAVFKHLGDGSEVVLDYDMIHVTPPQSAPDFIKKSPLADAAGWVDVDMYTTQHKKHPNVFSIGDASSLPNSKTAAAIRKQAPVCATNIVAFRKGQELPAKYNGYASCPLVTGYGRLILAEFGYGGEIMETMPFDQSQERYSMYFAKAHMLPAMYWHGMLKGRW